MKNILSSISEKALKNPDKIAFAFMKEDSPDEGYNQISFKELDEKSSRAAILLSRQGFHEGVVTLVLVKPSVDFEILLYGMLKTGAKTEGCTVISLNFQRGLWFVRHDAW